MILSQIHSFMGFQLKLLGFWTFLLSALIFGHSQKVTVNVAGTINCRDCIKHELTTRKEHSGLHVTVHCDFQDRETKTQGISSVDKEGNFNITISAEMMEDKNQKHRCYATLQSAITTRCPIHKAGTAWVKNISFHHIATQTLHNIHGPIVFSPVTCQSAFFWPFLKFPPKPEFILPYPSPPITSEPPVQLEFPPSPLTPRIPLIPSPAPTGSEYGNPFPPPTSAVRIPLSPPLPPTLPPSSQECGNLFPPSQMPTYLPPKEPMPSPAPIQKPIPPPFSKPPVYVSTPSAAPPYPMPSEKLSPPPSPSPTVVLLTPPIHYREPNPIPRPPPVPLLPGKFINPPKPKSRS